MRQSGSKVIKNSQGRNVKNQGIIKKLKSEGSSLITQPNGNNISGSIPRQC